MYHKKRRIAFVFLIAFFIISLFYFFNRGAFDVVLRDMFEEKLSEIYKADVNIKKVTGGILSGITLEKVKISWKQAGSIDNLRADEISTTILYFDLLKPDYKFRGNIFLKNTVIQLKRYLSFPFAQAILSIKEFSKIPVTSSETRNGIMSIHEGQLIIDNLQRVQFDLKNVSLNVESPSPDEVIIAVLGISPEKPFLNKFYLKDYYNRKDDTSLTQFDLVNYSLTQLDVLSPHFKVLGGLANIHVIKKDNTITEGSVFLKDLHVEFKRGDETKNVVMDMSLNLDQDILTINWIDFYYEKLKLDVQGVIKEFYENPTAYLNVNYYGAENSITFTIFGPIDNLETELTIESMKGEDALIPFISVKSRIDDVLLQYDGLEITGFSGNVDLGDDFEAIPFSGNAKITPSGIAIDKLKIFDIFNVIGNINLQPKLFLDLMIFCTETELSEILKFINIDIKEWIPDTDVLVSLTMKIIGSLNEIVLLPKLNLESELGKAVVSADISGEELQFDIKVSDFIIGNLEFDFDLLVQKKHQDEVGRTVFNIIINNFEINDVTLPGIIGEAILDSRNKVMFFENARIGKTYDVEGYFDIANNEIDIIVTFKESDINDLNFFMKKGKESIISGVLNGYIRVYGQLNNPSYEGKVKLEKGTINSIDFDIAFFNLIGSGTIIDLKNSRIARGTYQALILGFIDLKQPNIFQNVKFFSDQKSAYMAGFDVERSEFIDEYTFSRDLMDKWNLKFRTSRDDIYGYGQGQDRATELELEFSIDDDDNFFFRLDEDEGAFGIKKKYKF